MTDEKNKHAPGEDAAETGSPPEETERPDNAPQGNGESGGAKGWGKGGLEELKAENADLKNKLLRVVAEMENLRRRTERDKADTAKYAISNFARDVLTIADNIQRTIDHVPADAAEKDPALKSFLEGVQVTERELLKVMERHGIARLDPEGERFDPNRHQAMFEVENTDVPEGTVVQVVQAGYVIADRVLRPAMVGVAKGGPKPVKVETAQALQDPLKAASNDTAETESGEPADPPKNDSAKKKVGGKLDKSA
jgi:molecular chaperone GrpE